MFSPSFLLSALLSITSSERAGGGGTGPCSPCPWSHTLLTEGICFLCQWAWPLGGISPRGPPAVHLLWRQRKRTCPLWQGRPPTALSLDRRADYSSSAQTTSFPSHATCLPGNEREPTVFPVLGPRQTQRHTTWSLPSPSPVGRVRRLRGTRVDLNSASSDAGLGTQSDRASGQESPMVVGLVRGGRGGQAGMPRPRPSRAKDLEKHKSQMHAERQWKLV